MSGHIDFVKSNMSINIIYPWSFVIFISVINKSYIPYFINNVYKLDNTICYVNNFRIKTMFGSSLSQLFVGNPNNPVVILRFA